jgi:hypothetical protein
MVDAVGTTHHVRLGGSYLLIHPNSYIKRAAPTFGARFSGGDPGYDNLAFWQHWGQSCWIGGMGERDWEDDSMYDVGIGVDTSNHDLVTLARGLTPGGTNSDLDGEQTRRIFLTFQDHLYALKVGGIAPARLHRYNEADDSWELRKTWDDLTARSMANFSSDFYVGTSGRRIRKFDAGKWSTVSKPKGRNEIPFVMAPYRQRLYCGFGRFLYRLKPNDKWDGNAVFFDGKGIDIYASAAYHQGFLYLLSRNGHVIRTDGNQTFDLFQFDGHTIGLALKSYDGKLFVTTQEWYDDEDVGELALYQFSGAAVTELRRWGRSGMACGTGAMTVVARRLFYGASSLLGVDENGGGFGLAVYDAREDAHSLFAVQRDEVLYPPGVDTKAHIVDDVVYWGDRLFVSVRGHGIFRVKYSHRDLEREIAEFDTSYPVGVPAGVPEGGSLTSSEFDGGTPGLDKLWRKIQLTVDLLDAGSSVVVEYSTDAGKTWVVAGTATKDTSSTRYVRDFFLPNVRAPRFKYRLQLRSDTSLASPIVRSVIVAFVPVPEPNWVWQFTGVLSDTVQLLDGTTRTQDPEAIKAALETAFRDQQLVYFQDVNGDEWTLSGETEMPGVLMTDLVFSAPVITHNSDGSVEYTVQVSLLEAVESYT